jgi:glucose-1-phosphate thymidylyltransferase
MKAIILCAGLGTRLRPLTYTTAKHLIPVGNRPVLYYGIESLCDVGIRDIGIIVSKESWPIIANAVDDGSRWGAQVTYIEQPEPRGLAHAAQCAEAFVDGSDFLMYLGDNIIPEGLRGIVDRFRSSRANAVIMLKEVDDPGAFGIAVLDGERIVRLVEKPKQPPSNLAIVGAYLFDATIFESIRRIKPSWRNEYEITDAIQMSIDRGLTVYPYVMKGWWKDTGKAEDILAANRAILEGIQPDLRGGIDDGSKVDGNVFMGSESLLVRSRLIGPVVIGAGVEIIDSTVGPFVSVGDRSRIERCVVANTVMMEGCVLRGVRQPIEGSLIGRKVEVAGSNDSAPLVRLVVADDSKVEVGT